MSTCELKSVQLSVRRCPRAPGRRVRTHMIQVRSITELADDSSARRSEYINRAETRLTIGRVEYARRISWPTDDTNDTLKHHEA